jgi:hypothetical protein
VTDPDRFPLSVLARLDILLPDVSARLADSEAREALLEILDGGGLDPELGPVLLRHREGNSRALQGRSVLYALEQAQRKLSEEIVAVLCGTPDDQYDADAEEALLARQQHTLEAKGVPVPARPQRGEGVLLGG